MNQLSKSKFNRITADVGVSTVGAILVLMMFRYGDIRSALLTLLIFGIFKKMMVGLVGQWLNG